MYFVIIFCLISYCIMIHEIKPIISINLTTTAVKRSQLENITNFLADLSVFLEERQYAPYRTLLDTIEPKLAKTVSDRICLQQLSYAFANPLKKRWTSKLLDSSGPLLPAGLFSGTYISLGDFDSCLAINSHNEYHEWKLRGKYCLVTVRLPTNAEHEIDFRFPRPANQSWPLTLASEWTELNVRFPIAHSLCIPSNCEQNFIRDIILKAFRPLNSLNVNVDYCQTEESARESRFTGWPIALLLIYSLSALVAILLTCGTFAELCRHPESVSTDKEQSLSFALLTSFSVLANFRDLFRVRRAATISYSWIDGIRCLLTVIVLFSHVSVNQSVQQHSAVVPFAHYPHDFIRQISSPLNRYLVNSTFCIKAYFMISAFLLTAKHKKLYAFPRYLVSRWLRFTPTLCGYVAFSFALVHLGNGPLFHPALIAPYVQPCVDHLWMQLLYVNNWFDFRYSCGFQTWYISSDFQLYLLAYIVLVLLNRGKENLAVIVSVFLIFVSYLISFILFTFGKQGIPFFVSVVFPQLPIADKGYLIYWTATYNHLDAYFLGILLGIVVSKKLAIPISESSVRVLWNSALIALVALPQIFPWFLKSNAQRSLLNLIDSHSWFDALIMIGFHTCWLTLFAWIFYAAVTYSHCLKQNLAMRFLSSPMFAPFSRLCFCMYLVHVPLTWFNVHSSRYPQMRDEYGATQFVIMSFANSLFAAILLYVFFEAPFAKMFNFLFVSYDRRSKILSQGKVDSEQNETTQEIEMIATNQVNSDNFNSVFVIAKL